MVERGAHPRSGGWTPPNDHKLPSGGAWKPGEWNPPADYVPPGEHWPRASFSNVRDRYIREACRAAQRMALALLHGMAELRLSENALAEKADVDRDVVRKVIYGTGWVQVNTAVLLLTAVDADLIVSEHEVNPPG